MIIGKKEFGKIGDESVMIFRIRNKSGMELSLTNYGATIVGLTAKDRYGNFGDIVLGYEDLNSYIISDGCIGASIGRFANRIGGAKFELYGIEYKLTANDRGNTLHGSGWNKKIFDYKVCENAIEFLIVDEDGSYGFPGTVNASIKYTLTDDNRVVIDYKATTDKDTFVSLTNHSYFNLSCGGEILEHQLYINSDYYVPVDEQLIPTGEVLPVDGTSFDFRNIRRISSGFYDHTFVLNNDKEYSMVLYDSTTGRKMLVKTDMPSVQLYCSGMLTDRLGKMGKRYGRYSGVCLETQYYPNTPNVPQFPSALLKPNEEYVKRTEFKFEVD